MTFPPGVVEIARRVRAKELSAREVTDAYLARIDAHGGTLAAVESGYIQNAIHESAYRAQQGSIGDVNTERPGVFSASAIPYRSTCEVHQKVLL